MPKALVIGGGAREHAIAHGLKRSGCDVIVAPGNAGIANAFECIPPPEAGVPGFMSVARDLRPDIVVIGPEAPLVAGLPDILVDEGFAVFGPTKQAAMVTEGSKAECRRLLQEAGVPSPKYRIAPTRQQALDYAQGLPGGIVVKADGLAAGKGVMVCVNSTEAAAAVERIMDPSFANGAGATVVFEELLVGTECSFMAFTDGTNAVPLRRARDYKRLLNGDQGGMTGGMGSYAPVEEADGFEEKVMDTIVYPTINALRRKGVPYRGVLYFGLMLCSDGSIKVLEINARLGDPEAQVILPTLETNLYDLMLAATKEGGLQGLKLEWSAQSAVGVVLASAGYPDVATRPQPFFGLDEVGKMENVLMYYAGVGVQQETFLATGGRVLTVVGLGADRALARKTCYEAVSKIHFHGMQFRTDIAA